MRGDGFLARLSLDPAGPDRWTAAAGDGADGIARGVLAAQSMIAAGRTVDTRWRWVHSLQVTHLDDRGAADPAAPVEHVVEKTHETEHGAVRLVHSRQGAAALALTTVSFATPRQGLGPTHQPAIAIDELPPPDSLARTATGGLFDVRHVDRAPWQRPTDPTAPNRMWVRATEEITDEILLHAAALVMATDLLLVEPVATGISRDWTDFATGGGLRAAGLDLSMWFHRGFRADDWVLHEHETPSAADYRAFTTGRFVSSMGRLIASVSQQTALLPIAKNSVPVIERSEQCSTMSP